MANPIIEDVSEFALESSSDLPIIDTQPLALEHLQTQLKLQDELLQQQREFMERQSLRDPSFKISNPSWSFTQGLVIGQVSVIIVIIIFVKFFVFADHSPSPTKSLARDVSGVIVKRNKKKNGEDSDEQLSSSKMSTILEKTYYDVENHASESLDWFNVLVAQTISQLRTEALLSDNIYHSLDEFLSKSELPDYLNKIKLTEIDIGDDFPICSNCRIIHSTDGSGRLEAKIDVDLADTLTLGIETKLLLNHPRPLTAILPVLLSVSIVRFSGCLTVSLINTNEHNWSEDGEDMRKEDKSERYEKRDVQSTPRDSGSSYATSDPRDPSAASSFTLAPNIGSPQIDPQESSQTSSPHKSPQSKARTSSKSHSTAPSASDSKKHKSDSTDGTALMFSFAPDYRLEFTVKSLIGSRAKLQDVPKISALIESKLRSWFTDRCVEPRFQLVKLPSLWPRRKNTREPVHANSAGVVDKAELVNE